MAQRGTKAHMAMSCLRALPHVTPICAPCLAARGVAFSDESHAPGNWPRTCRNTFSRVDDDYSIRMAWSLAGAALLLALGQGVGAAATITVTTNNPNIIADGQCSLIEAIVNANNDAATSLTAPRAVERTQLCYRQTPT